MTKKDEKMFFDLLSWEGEDWKDYWQGVNMEHVCREFSDNTVYVMGVYPYYEKLDYKKAGAVYIVKEK